MFLVHHKYKGHFINCVFVQQLIVPLLHNFITFLDANCLQRMEKVALWNGLDAQNVVGVENCFEVLLFKEWFSKFIDIVIVRVFFLEVLLA